MMQKKICMIGATAVGKTSLVRRYIQNLYSEGYHTTIGVKVDKKVLDNVTLMLWDIYGDDELQGMRSSYLRGAAGYLLVVDSTRVKTLDKARELKGKIDEALGEIPFVLALNKTDLTDAWDMPDELPSEWTILRTSAKTGANVEEAFAALAAKLAS